MNIIQVFARTAKQKKHIYQAISTLNRTNTKRPAFGWKMWYKQKEWIRSKSRMENNWVITNINYMWIFSGYKNQIDYFFIPTRETSNVTNVKTLPRINCRSASLLKTNKIEKWIPFLKPKNKKQFKQAWKTYNNLNQMGPE